MVSKLAEEYRTVSEKLRENPVADQSWIALQNLLTRAGLEDAEISLDILQLCHEHLSVAHSKDKHVSAILDTLKNVILVTRAPLENVVNLLTSAMDGLEGRHTSNSSFMDPHVAISVMGTIFNGLQLADLGSASRVLFERAQGILLSSVKTKQEQTLVQSLTLLFPSLASVDEKVIPRLFHLIEKSLFSSEIGTGNHPGLLALCCLADFLFEDPRAEFIFSQEWFWTAVQAGLSGVVSLDRKRSLYLLKRFIDCARKRVSVLCCVNYFPSDLASFERLCKTTFYDFFLIVETLEEKQMHIIRPVLTKLDRLIALCGKADETFHYSWLLVIFHRLLTHENLQVVKWALQKTFTMDTSKCQFLFQSEKTFLTSTLVRALNNLTFFAKLKTENGNGQPGNLAGQLAQFCSGFDDSSFLGNFLQEILNQTWNSVSLYHTVHALTRIPRRELLGSESLQILQSILSSALHTQHRFIKAAVQCHILEIVSNLSEISFESLQLISVIISSLNPHEAFVRGSPGYLNFATWLKTSYSHNELTELIRVLTNLYYELPGKHEKLILSTLNEPLPLARFIVLLLDMGVEQPADFLEESLAHLASTVQNCHERPYLDKNALKKSVKLITALLNETGFSYGTQKDCTREQLENFLKPRLTSVSNFIISQVSVISDFEEIDIYLDFAQSLAAERRRQVLGADGAVSELCCRELFGDSPFPCKYFAVSLLLLIGDRDEKLVQQLRESRVHCAPGVREKGNFSNSSWGFYMSNFFGKVWRLLRSCLEECPPLNDPEDLLSDASVALDVGGVNAVVDIFRCVEYVLPRAASASDLCKNIMNQCWNLCFEFRKMDRFWHFVESFSDLVFRPDLLEDEELGPFVLSYAKQLRDQGESINGLCNLAAKRIVDCWMEKIPQPESHRIEFLRDLVTFGGVPRKDEVITSETCAYIYSQGSACAANIHLKSPHAIDNEARFQAIRFLLALPARSPWTWQLCESFLQLDSSLSNVKNRHFANSQTHRVKNRLWQGLHILVCRLPIDADKDDIILRACLNALVEHNPQPSVRFLQEWMVVRLLNRSSNVQSTFWETMDLAVQQRAGSMVSFIAIVIHWAKSIDQADCFQLFARKALPRILPWAMAQHYTPRLYAAVAVETVWNLCRKFQLHDVVSEFQKVHDLLQTVPEMGNTSKNIEKLKEDFYLQIFHAVEHFSLETIYYELPRLSHLAPDEWIPVTWFENVNVPADVPTRNPDGTLSECRPAEWVARAAGTAPLETEDHPGSLQDLDANNGNVQKKITPWMMMVPDIETFTAVPSVARKKQSEDCGLVLVASLVDRLPNLGGLCRTCEVLGVSRFVVPTLRLMDDKEFTSLSVSAEKWIPLQEVKPFQLGEYLAEMRKEGYLIVGAEQTANSVPLHKFQFPRKTVLLLGNEKEGIPVNLIQQLDVCVEVPQSGIIRSMNVHVTGALFIWEYARQHLADS